MIFYKVLLFIIIIIYHNFLIQLFLVQIVLYLSFDFPILNFFLIWVKNILHEMNHNK